MKFFNTAGPISLDDHYALPPLHRIDLDELLHMIRQKKLFVLYAPRQTGKTSTLLALMDHLNTNGDYRCVYVNVEPGQTAREDVAAAMRSILGALAHSLAFYLNDDSLSHRIDTLIQQNGPHLALQIGLSNIAQASPKPLVLLIDEIDALIGDTLVSVLRQLRAGYTMRPKGFPQSVVLCGVRDVRDYRIHASSEKDPVTGGSAFNVKAASLRLGNFSSEETRTLLQQHSDATGQTFSDDTLQAVWTQSQGQP